MLLADLTWPDFDTRRHRDLVILPIGAVEPHGPHLPLGADTMISDYFAHRLAADLDATIAPTIGYGVATPPQRLGGVFPGVLAISGTTFTHLVTEILTALAEHGARQVVIVNSAIDNLSFLCEAARIVTAASADARIMIVAWWDVVGEPFRNALAAETGVARTDDHHAGMVESSLTVHIAPAATRPDLADTDPAVSPARRFSYDVFPLPPDAATSSGIVYTANKASAEIGARVADQVAHEMAAAVRLEFGLEAGRR
ncbi:creatininase family protein [Nocardia cyriacigeorgica]|uniref:creatininase family protein n=1 Tax=Nocardia cyriacigeorgica TaxID=135487 RepID=UPI002453787F|nr:creatininase family protein [Nocardia cyriacigeorgica]